MVVSMEKILKEHNVIPYGRVQEAFLAANRTCVIQPTGTGKSFLAIKWLYDNRDKKGLFLAPSYVILNQLKKQIESCGLDLKKDFPNLELGLYSNASQYAPKKYDCIVLDEFHRCGSPVWGKNVNNILDNNPEAKVLGLSATPIRYSDNARDMSKELFDGNVASFMSLSEAVSTIPEFIPPKYVIGLYDLNMDKIQKKVSSVSSKQQKAFLQKKLNDVKNSLQNAMGMDVLFKKYITKKDGKYIIFCKDVAHMKEMKKHLNDWFKSINQEIDTYEIYYRNDEEMNDYYLDRFQNNNNSHLKLLLSIEILNEGLHVEDIDGVIMLRSTGSPRVYFQQLGRAMLVGSKKQNIVFDIVNNVYSHRMFYDFINELSQNKNISQKMIEDFLIYDDYLEIIEELEQIEYDAVMTWDKWFILAQNYYEKYGDLLVPTGKIYDGKPNPHSSLGNWISTQRVQYKKGLMQQKDKNRVAKLNSINMVWDVLDNRWQEMYEKAQKYYEQNHNLQLSSANDDEELKLKEWVESQRKRYNHGYMKRNAPEQIKKLESIGMIWNVMDNQWNKMYELAKKYYDTYKNLNVPQGFLTLDGISFDSNGLNLSTWILHQRQDYKRIINGKSQLEDKKIQLLDKIGMIWYALEDAWNETYNKACEYYQKFNNLEVLIRKESNGKPNEYYELGKWISRQRQAFKNNTLQKKRIELLEKIGMVWDIRQNQWDTMYQKAKEFYEQNNHLRVSAFKTIQGEPNENIQLGIWIDTQRKDYKSGVMKKNHPERIALLEKIGMIWEVRKGPIIFSPVEDEEKRLARESTIKKLKATYEMLDDERKAIIIKEQPSSKKPK